jgi:hypothetical protein
MPGRAPAAGLPGAAEVLDFANRLLPVIAPEVRPARSVRSVPGSLRVRAVRAGEVAGRLAPGAGGRAGRGRVGRPGGGRPAVAAARAELTGRGIEFREVDRFDAGTRLALVPASAVKGLEFDQVVLVEPADIADPAWGGRPAAALHRPDPGRARPDHRPRQAAPRARAPAA